LELVKTVLKQYWILLTEKTKLPKKSFLNH
jgi:hypothetical protein